MRAYMFDLILHDSPELTRPYLVLSEVAGGLVTEESIEPGADKKFLGSAFIVQADSMAEVRARMEADVYWSGNVVSLLSSIALGNG